MKNVPASPSPLDQAKSPKTRQNELNKIIYNFTALPTTTVRKGKSLKWLRALIEKVIPIYLCLPVSYTITRMDCFKKVMIPF